MEFTSFRSKSNQTLQSLFLGLSSKFVNNFIEIGAREASASISFLKQMQTGRALAFEANPMTFEKITRGASNSGVEVYNFGISDNSVSQSMFIPIWKEDNLTPPNASFLTRSKDVTYLEVTVPCLTLDEVFSSKIIEGPTALWVDVEGFAYQVLSGAKESLKKTDIKIIFIEVEAERFWKAQFLVKEVSEQLKCRGFFLVARDFEYKNQYNQVYIHHSLLLKSTFLLSVYLVKLFLSIPIGIVSLVSNVLLRYRTNKIRLEQNNQTDTE